MLKKLLIMLIFCVFCIFGYSQEVDEESIFSGSTVEDTNKYVNNTITTNAEKTGVTLTGMITSSTSYIMHKKWLNGQTNTDLNQFLGYMQGNLFLDIRLTHGIKAFANIMAYYSPQGMLVPHYYMGYISNSVTNITLYETNNTVLSLKEFFADANISRTVYFRAGKQVLQWGRCYFWDPSDLVNVEKKNFFDLTAYREGSYGLKMHIPFGTTANIYSYYNFTDVKKIEDIAVSEKFEFLINAFEFSLSVWAKNGSHPVYAFDFYTRFLGIDFYGEASFADFDFRQKVSNVTIVGNESPIVYSVTNQLVSKAAVGFSKSFDFMDLSDRITLIGEFYFNSAGYYENLFRNDSDRAIFMTQSYYDMLSGQMINGNFYEQNNHYAYYWALFVTYNQFILSDINLSINALGNCIDYSFVLGPSISYTPVYDFTLNLYTYFYIGEENTEYTFGGNAVNVNFSASINF